MAPTATERTDMSATIIAFPTAARFVEVRLESAGGNPLERAIDTARAISADIIGGLSTAVLASRLDHLRRMIARLEQTHLLALGDEAIIPFGPALLRWPLRHLPDALGGLLAGMKAA